MMSAEFFLAVLSDKCGVYSTGIRGRGQLDLQTYFLHTSYRTVLMLEILTLSMLEILTLSMLEIFTLSMLETLTLPNLEILTMPMLEILKCLLFLKNILNYAF